MNMKPTAGAILIALSLIISNVGRADEPRLSSNSAAVPKDEEILNNVAIIDLAKIGLREDIIIEKIKSSRCEFDTSISGLTQLKGSAIPDSVIKAMVATRTPASVIKQSVVGDLNDPTTPHGAGVWVLQEISGKTKMTKLESDPPATFSSGGFVGPHGIGKRAQTAKWNTRQSDLQLSERRPAFYFYLGRTQQPGDPEFESARNPRDFMLVQFPKDTKGGERALEVSRAGGYGDSSGIAPGAVRQFTQEPVTDGVFKILPKTDLDEGEYTFCRVVTHGDRAFFTFGVQPK